MYLSFYGLQERPFNPTPDPRFLFLSPGHREALAQLEYGVRERRGFLVLTGEVGTGKTTLLQALLGRLGSDTEVAYIFNSRLSFEELLEYILEDFGIAASGLSHVQRLMALNRFLTERRRANLDTVLIIDEAQNLDPPTLEQIRLLSNFETPTEKLLQILLVGQPELQEKLLLPELRQLRQRIGLRCRIQPLSAGETREYIEHRLGVVRKPFSNPNSTMNGAAPFTGRAVRLISGYSRGIPRVANIVCDHCLLIGYADQEAQIGPNIVRQAIRYLEDGERPDRQPSEISLSSIAARWGLGSVTALGLLSIALSSGVLSNALSSVTILVSDLMRYFTRP